MNSIKKIAISAGVISALPLFAFAQLYDTGLSIATLGQNIVNAVWIVFTVIAIICFVVAAVLFLTSNGQPEKIAKARSAFLWGVAGVVVGILAYTIISLVRGAMGA